MTAGRFGGGGANQGTGIRVSLSRRGDYAVRTMLALGRHAVSGAPELLPAARIAEQMGIPTGFLAHVLADLSRAGLVMGRAGRNGGYRLALPAVEIDLLRIVDAVEERSGLARCVLRGGPCDVDGRCAVHHAFAGATEALRAELRRTRLADLAAPH